VPVDPAFAPMLESIAAMPPPPPGSDPVASARAGTAMMFTHPSPPDVGVEERVLPGPSAAIPVRVYTPRDLDAPAGVLGYFHGGGFIAGSVDSHDGTVRELAAGAGCVAVSVEYRLAPEHPYPAALDDCLAALHWVAANAAEIGGDPGRIAIGGDSAGGNLAAAVALRNRDEGGPALAFQLLVYPVTDVACVTPSMTENATGYMLTADSMRWMWSNYLAGGVADAATDPYASPAAAPDLAGLPPAMVITAEYDPLRDEGEAYAARLLAAGVATDVIRYDGQIHGFFSMHALAPQSKAAIDAASGALRRAFSR
jgi:acetyl esterase/lipase